MTRKISFLFGAGAEGKGNFKLPIGLEFMQDSYLNETLNKELTAALDKYFNSKEFKRADSNYKYQKEKFLSQDATFSILKKWTAFLHNDVANLKDFQVEIHAVLNEGEFKEYLAAIYGDNPEAKDTIIKLAKTREADQGKEQLRKALKAEFHELFVTTSLEKVPNHKISKFLRTFLDQDNPTKFLEILPKGISHILDSSFHTIINPKKHGLIVFNKVFNYYWTIMFSIYLHIKYQIDDLSQDVNVSNYYKQDIMYSELLNLKENIQELYFKVDKMIKEDKLTGNYYQLLKKGFQDYDISGVLTSNYFSFAKILSENVAYLNGSLNLFEIPENIDVIDILEEDLPQDKLFFPFIFGQSYTKPIVSNHQVQNFSKMTKILDDSNILIILGFNINEDDNHINAYLRNFLKTGTKDNPKNIIFVTNYLKQANKSNLFKDLKLNEKLRIGQDLSNQVAILEVNYGNNQVVVDKIVEKVKEIENKFS